MINTLPDDHGLQTLQKVEFQSTLAISPEPAEFLIHYTTPIPSRWRRFWYRLLLGWEWREYEQQDS
jgi:hypothetical protein